MTKQERIVAQTEALIRDFKTFAIDYNNAKSSDGWQKDIETLNALLKLAKRDVGVRPLYGEDADGNAYAVCRECSKILGNTDDLHQSVWIPHLCPDCGKKIDWSESDE